MKQILHLLQMSDTAFPVGAFSFSSGLESAASAGVVCNAESLRAYVETMLRQSATTDSVAALTAYRAAKNNSYSGVLDADNALLACKLNDEARIMQQRMGKKLTELAMQLFPNDLLALFLDDIERGAAPGTYAAAQGLCFAISGLTQRQLFASQQYGVASMIVGAALRCCRVSHYETQRILYDLAASTDSLYLSIKDLTINDMHSFMPQADIFASLHEKGKIRMFMN
jgi:urease accessory protein